MEVRIAPEFRGKNIARNAFRTLAARSNKSSWRGFRYAFLGVALFASYPARPVIAEPSTTLTPLSQKTSAQLRLPGLDGRTHDLTAHAGSIVIVHFFATWCEPCRAELKVLTRLSTAKGDLSNIAIIAVNVAEPAQRVRRFLKTSPVNFPVLLDHDRSAAKSWNVSILPTSFILDPKLVPRRLAEGDVDWMSKKVRSELAELAN